jgi:hypothetical protein
MAGRRSTVDLVIRSLLVAGAVLFVLLLSGIGSGLMTRPAPYHPPTPAASHTKCGGRPDAGAPPGGV